MHVWYGWMLQSDLRKQETSVTLKVRCYKQMGSYRWSMFATLSFRQLTSDCMSISQLIWRTLKELVSTTILPSLLVVKNVPALFAVLSLVLCFESKNKCNDFVLLATRMLRYSASHHFSRVRCTFSIFTED